MSTHSFLFIIIAIFAYIFIILVGFAICGYAESHGITWAYQLKLNLKIWINDHLFRIPGDYGPRKRT